VSFPFPVFSFPATNNKQLEWVRQLSLDPQNFIVAVVRNPSTSTLLQPLLGPKVVVVKADLEDFDSFPQIAAEIAKVGGGKIDVLIKCVPFVFT
jgi:NAD(P)-dependent dehydrogenase (short-subunit alcohol dehydrogenase family)